jgi:hypothetical protein
VVKSEGVFLHKEMNQRVRGGDPDEFACRAQPNAQIVQGE